MTRVILAPSADLAHRVLETEDVVLTVEAEYGAFVAEGRLYTAAHHQPAGTKYAGTHVGGTRSSPCNDTNIPVLDGGDGAVLVSHVDLDTFGGCLRALGGFEGLFVYKGFWTLAEFVDVRGPHKLGRSGASERDLRALYAFWAWSKASPRLPRDQVTDVTDLVRSAGAALVKILAGDTEMLAAGDAMRAAETDLNRRTFVRRDGPIIVRIAEVGRDFCNHLYADPSGAPASAVACYNRENGSVTISLADLVPGVSCRAIVQSLWGPEAGGHDGIAGSPRGQDMTEAGLRAVVDELLTRLVLGWYSASTRLVLG
jgi:hypothetical protein